MTAHGLIIAAPHSGAGKTTVTLAILAALQRRGVAVRAAKAGPDYIDPAFHAAATRSPSVNLDSWAMPPPLLDAMAAQAAAGADIFVVEGVMGLFDGVDGPPGRRGTTADLAARFELPVLLVLDVAGQSQSAAAVLRGFATHDPQVRIAGVILNRVASERHPSRDGSPPRLPISACRCSARSRATTRWRCPSATSVWCRRASTATWQRDSIAWPGIGRAAYRSRRRDRDRDTADDAT